MKKEKVIQCIWTVIQLVISALIIVTTILQIVGGMMYKLPHIIILGVIVLLGITLLVLDVILKDKKSIIIHLSILPIWIFLQILKLCYF